MQSTINKDDLLTDKDCQQFSKTYRTICQIYYQNTQNGNTVEDLINLTSIIPQIICTKAQSNAMMIFSQIQILKAKAKNEPILRQKIQKAIQHLRKPTKEKLIANLAIQLLKKNQLYTIGCIISIRLFNQFVQSNQLDSKSIFQCLGNNLFVNPSLTVELLQLLCGHSQQNSHLTVRAGIVKALFLNYIPKTMKDKLTLYKCIKLLKTIANVEPSILRQRQKTLSAVICTYQEYIPIVEDICAKCYDAQYSTQIDQHNAIQNIDQFYLWSHNSSFCREILSKQFVNTIPDSLKGKKIFSPEIQAKAYAIIGNYCKHCEYLNKQFLKLLPKNQESLLNYIKMCISLVRIDPGTIQLIDWPSLDKMIALTSNSKVLQLHKMLKEMIGKTVQVGTLNNSLKSIFASEKNADLLGERASRIPKNNLQLEDTKHILNEKSSAGASQFDQDTLQMMKEKAIESLHVAISRKHKLNLNPLINEYQFNNIQLLSKFLQAVELNLMMNENSVDELNINKILEMIRWMEENYNGEIIDWGVIIEILGIIFEEGEWLKRIKSLPKDCFWLLQIEELSPKNQQILFSTIQNAIKSSNTKKLSMIMGFLGKKIQNSLKIKLLKTYAKVFESIKQQLQKDINYKLHLMMLSYFIRGWHLEQTEPNYQSNNKEFKNFIRPLVDIVVTTYKALPQQHHFLQSCLPFKIHPHSLTKNINPLINTHGKLAAYLHQNQPKGNNTHLASDRFNSISTLSPSIILENLKFLAQNPQLINIGELQRLLQRITKNKDSYWDLYPYYVDIISLITELIGAEIPSIKPHITNDIVDIITEVEQNQDVQKEEREDLLYDMCDTLEGLQKRGTYIEIERIRKIVTRIIEEQVREEIIIILNNYDIKQQAPKAQQIKKEQKVSSPIKKTQSISRFQQIKKEEKNNSQAELRMQANLQAFIGNQQQRPVQILKKAEGQSLEHLFQSVKYQSAPNGLYEALQILKKIIDKKEPPNRFNQIYPILSKSTPSQPQKELLGSLLAKFYPMQFQEKALALLLDKQRTTLAKQEFQELVRTYTHAFRLVRRWKFQSREALDISMLRIKQEYLQDACIVSIYNLKKSASEIQYFFSKKYHKIIPEVLCKVLSEDEVVQFLTLVGTVAKLPQIKQFFLQQKMHTKIMPLNSLFPMSVRVNSSLCYALSTLSFEQANACGEIVIMKEPMTIIYQCLRSESKNKAIVEPGVCLIANLSYPNPQLKETLRQRKTVSLLLELFQNNLPNPQESIYKQLLRGLGNFSMIKSGAQQIIDGHFCDLAVRMAENLDFFVYYDDKKARLMKLLINLISNLANHKIKLQLMHQEKITLLILTMLETTEKNGQLLAGCIDTVDALCQSPLIQLYTIQQKRLLYILMDVLKLQEQTTILLKTGRLVSNLSIHGQCIPYILKANIMSVIGNVVVPNLYIGIMTEEQSKRLETYVLKILTRIHSFKPDINLVLKSGYLDCLVRIIELTDVEDDHLQILFFYSKHLPNFLNKRAFSCLVKTLTKKIDSNVTIGKCIISFKNLLTFSYNRDDDLEVIGNIPQIYEKILKSQFFVDGLFLLVYHLLRSHNLRKTFKKRQDKVMQTIQKLGKEQIYLDISRTILFLIYNPFTPLWIAPLCQTHQDQQQFYRILRDGFKCKLYRADGSHKSAKLDIDDEYNIRIFKYPGGEIKDKYTLNINHIRDIQIDFRENDELWSHTVFSMGKSFLESHVPNRKLCVTIIGSSRWGEVKLINFEFSSEEQKLWFYQCVSHLIYLFKT